MVNIQPNNTDDLQGIPLWYNSKLGNRILPRWMKNGVYMLSDLVSKNAKILSQSEIELQYGFKTNFLEYGNVKYHVDRYIHACLPPDFSSFQKEIGPLFSTELLIGESKLYKILNSNKVKIFLDIPEKWETKTGIRFTNDEIDNSFISNHKSNVNMYMRYIQFRILHYRIATKSESYKKKIVTDDSCEYFKQVESIEHLFYECEKSTLLWFKVQEWIKRMGFGNYNLEIRSIILGESRKKYKLINIILLATKMIIYSNCNKYFRLSLDQVKFVMKDLFHLEKYWAETNDRMAVFLGTWHPVYKEMINMKS